MHTPEEPRFPPPSGHAGRRKRLLAMRSKEPSGAGAIQAECHAAIPGVPSLEGARGLRQLVGLLARDSPSGAAFPCTRLSAQWHAAPLSSLTAAGPPRNRTGFPLSADPSFGIGDQCLCLETVACCHEQQREAKVPATRPFCQYLFGNTTLIVRHFSGRLTARRETGVTLSRRCHGERSFRPERARRRGP